MIKINIKDIPRDGLNLDQTIQAQDIDLQDSAFKCLAPIDILARVERAEDAILVKVRVEGKYEFTCGRCLEPIQQERKDLFDLYFEVDDQTEGIDLGEEVRQELLITFSKVVVCKDDCKGLCPKCGTNLNTETCKCAEKVEAHTTLEKEV